MSAVAAVAGPASQPMWRRALQHRSFVFGGVLSALLVFAAVLSMFWTPWSPYEMNLPNKLQSPTAQHWLGTSGEPAVEMDVRCEAHLHLVCRHVHGQGTVPRRENGVSDRAWRRGLLGQEPHPIGCDHLLGRSHWFR